MIDVGASGGLEPRWRSVRHHVKAFLFEPDERSHVNLAFADYVEKIFPVGLGAAETVASLNLCRKPTVSSLLRPRRPFLSRFADVERFDVIASEAVNLSTLDVCLLDRSEDCDFIKLDTQGTEIDILRGGAGLLEGPLIGLEVEVEFIRLYERQALFGDVCAHLEGLGYEFFDFVNISRWERERFTLFGQAVFGDGLFLRSPEIFAEILCTLPSNIARSKAKKYVAIVSLYDHPDILPVCMRLFGQFFDQTDLNAVGVLHRKLLRRRRMSSFLLFAVNKLLRAFGIRATGLQIS